MTVGDLTLLPTSWGAVVKGNTIDVKVVGTMKPTVNVLIACVTLDIGPLNAGSYTVNFIEDYSAGGGSVSIVKSSVLVVSAASEPIPASSPLTLAVLCSLLALIALLCWPARTDA